MNITLARDTLQELVYSGMEECVICPGARNVPLMNVLLNEAKIKKWWGYEERSAAFFALGRVRERGRPVAVVTTSGTAVGELLPAAMEAYYTAQPLVLLTADRPRRFREVNAPQTCDQKGIFGVYAPDSWDVEKEERVDLTTWTGRAPLHLNLCFEEPAHEKVETEPLRYPLFREKLWNPPLEGLEPFLKRAEKLLVIVSALRKEVQPAVSRFLETVGGDFYIEATSGLRERFKSVNPELKHYTHVLRIGGVPTHRIWRNIEEEHTVEVFSLTEAPFSGISWGASVCCNLEFLPPVAFGKKPVGGRAERETGLLTELSARLPKNSLVYLGNSLPIRQWDAMATHEDRGFTIQASRGLNGIDGQISTFLGLCRGGRSNWAILGDLTTLYDFAAPWFIPQLSIEDMTIVVLNNRGGKIFEKMFPIPEMINPHSLSFEPFAKMWNLDYERWEKIPLHVEGRRPRLVEITL